MSETRDDDLKRDPALTALYRAADDEAPPPALDAAILAAAHRAVGARPRPAGHTFVRSWRGALSAAAVLVLSVSLVIVMREEAPDVLSPHGFDEQPAADSKSKYDLTSKNVEQEKGGQRTQADANMPKSVGLKPSSEMPASGLAMRAPSASEVGRSAKDALEAKPELPPAPATSAERRETTAQMNERIDRPASESKLERPAVKQEPAKEFVPAPPPRAAEPPAERQMQAGALNSGKMAEAPAPPKVAALDAQREADSAERVQTRDNRARSAAEAVASAPAVAQVAPAAKPAPMPLKKRGDADLSPEKWLERIEELRKQGRLDEARASLAEFKKRYPDYRLPESLRDGIK